MPEGQCQFCRLGDQRGSTASSGQKEGGGRDTQGEAA